MVGPSRSDEERRAASRRLRLGFVGLVAASGGLVAVAADATPTQTIGAAAAGLLVGVALLAFLAHVGREWRGSRRP